MALLVLFRGQILLAALWVLLFVFVQVRTIGTQIVLKLFSFIALGVALAAVVMIATFKYQDEAFALMDRFTNLFLNFEKTGELSMADGRVAELNYFMQMYPEWKLIPGHGVGALWYDFFMACLEMR